MANILRYRTFNEAKAVVDTATSLSISTPLVNAGDLLIAAVATDEDTSATLSAPSGWTSINSPGSYSSAVTLVLVEDCNRDRTGISHVYLGRGATGIRLDDAIYR